MADIDKRFTILQREYIETVDANTKLLTTGYYEQVEYVEPRRYPDGQVVNEKRTRQVKRDGYLKQLEDFGNNRDCDLNPKAARGAPRVKKPKLNPELNGFLTLNEIICDINCQLDKIWDEVERDRTWLAQKPLIMLPALANQVRYILDTTGVDHTEVARRIARLTDKWVDMARRTLNHTVADTMFDGTVCSNCGGALAVPARVEGMQTVVRCVGTPAAPPCGESYPASEWLALYERSQK